MIIEIKRKNMLDDSILILTLPKETNSLSQFFFYIEQFIKKKKIIRNTSKNYYLRFIILFYIFDILGKDALKIHLTYSSVITIVHIIMRIEEISGNINS